MKASQGKIDRYLDGLSPATILAFTFCGVLLVGTADYVTGYEIGMSLFYAGPIGVAAWYAGRNAGLAIAILSCASWYIVDLASGHQYSNAAIPVWNALIRFGFFYITASLLTSLRRSLRAQQHLARTDELTGLYSRRDFENRLKHDLAMTQRRQTALTLAYVDVDDFKAVNDTRGHCSGDQVLRAIGQVLKNSVSEVETAARVGGDEFALILPDTDDRSAREAISKLTSDVRDALSAIDSAITCSIGVVTLLDPDTSPLDAVASADRLMYEAKSNGKGGVAYGVRGRAGRNGGR